MAKLSLEEIQVKLREMDGWRLSGQTIVKQFAFAGFPEAVAFVNRLVPGAEAADHHPDITINYRRVTVSYSTHSEGAITEKDLDGARMADACARSGFLPSEGRA